MMPWVTTSADVPLGCSTKNATPACLAPFTLAAVSSAAKSLPLAYQTSCMRESLLGGLVSGLENGPPAVKKKRQQPVPNGVEIELSARHWPSGKGPAFWDELEGTAYVCVLTVPVLRFTAGLAPFSDCVFVSCQLTSSLKAPVLENTARELSRNSVPPLSVRKSVPGERAGKTVKP